MIGDILRELIVVSITRLIGVTGTLVALRILTEFVPTEVFGVSSLALGIGSFLSNALIAPILHSVRRYYPELGPNAAYYLRSEVERSLGQTLLLICAILLIVFAGSCFVLQWEIPLIPMLAILIIVECKANIEKYFLLAAGRHLAFGIWDVLESLAKPIGAVLLIVLAGPSATRVVLGYSVGAVIVMLGMSSVIRREGLAIPLGPPPSDLGSQIIHYACPLMIMAIPTAVSGVGDRYVLAFVVPAGDVGLYVAAYGLVSQPFLIIQGVLSQVLQPKYFQAIGNNKQDERRIFSVWLWAMAVFSLLGVLGIWFLRDQLSALLVADAYRACATVMPSIALGYGFLAIAFVFYARCYAYKSTRFMTIGRTVGAVTSIALCGPFVSVWGLMGAGASCACAFLIELAVAAALSRLSMHSSRREITHSVNA